jgi:hypothetical protein
MLATLVDTQALAETVLAAVLGGVGVTLIFSIAILGASRFADLSRDGRSAAAVAFGLVALVALAAFAAAIAFGIIVMTSK